METRSLGGALRRLLVLLVPWALLLAIAAYARWRSCFVDEAPFIELAPGVAVDEYCSAELREGFPLDLLGVSAFFAVVALVWTVSVLRSRASERRSAGRRS